MFWEKFHLVAVKFQISFGNSVSPTCACMMSHVAMLYHNLAQAELDQDAKYLGQKQSILFKAF